MQVEMVGTGERTHVTQNVGQTLIAAGLAKEVKPTVEKPKPNTKFTPVMPKPIGDYQPPPGIMYSTVCCGSRGVCESERGTAHLSLVVRHCGVAEQVPDEVAAQYLELFNQWKSRARKPQLPKISASDTRFIRQFGMKTKDELITEAQAELILAKRK